LSANVGLSTASTFSEPSVFNRKLTRMKKWPSVILIALVASGARAAGGDPPALVGSLSHVDGPVWLRSAGHANGDLAGRNWPVSAGDSIRTRDARAELQLGMALCRLDRESEITLLALDEATARLRVSSGSLSIEVRQIPEHSIRLQLRDALVELRQAGEYRVDVAPDGVSVLVRSGEAIISTSKARFQQFSREQARIGLDGTLKLAKASGADASDDWVRTRTRNTNGTQSVLHVPTGLVGYESLEGYGEWSWAREYGMVWQPRRVSRDWAPYRFGQWIWKAPWGWTWIDDAPWAFAPSHYGRWVELNQRWFWVPGPRQLPATYVPAAVGWIKSTTEDQFGWYPLGPREPYATPYPASDQYTRRINTFAVVRSRASVEEKQATTAITWAPAAEFSAHPAPLQMQTRRRLAYK
jgi:hypothetical protein